MGETRPTRDVAARRGGASGLRPLPRAGPALRSVVAAVAISVVAGCSGIKVHKHATLDRTNPGASGATTPVPDEALDLLHGGIAAEKADPRLAIRSYRDAALKALPYALAEGDTGRDGDGVTGPRLVYRRAIEYAVQAAGRVAKAEGLRWTDVLAREGIAVRGMVSAFRPAQWDEALPARSFEVTGFHQRIARGGLGAPLVLARGVAKDAPVRPEDRYYPRDLNKAATALILPDAGGAAVLDLVDPQRDPDMGWGPGPDGKPLRLAYDLTTPIGRQFSSPRLSLNSTLGVLFPDRLDTRTGLYLEDPYEPGKIPVVLVHGLASGPEAWADALNELRGDPELRKRYQFWMFYYTTGNPILTSAAELRKALKDAREEFDPGHKDPALDRMVLVGHSMGGLLSRLSVVSSERGFWDLASKIPPDQIAIEPRLKTRLVDALIFEPVASVSRVVFISTPHKGSPLGYEFVGRLVSSMIRMPETVSEASKALVKAVGVQNVPPEFRNRRELTSVRQLSPGNAVLEEMNRLPIPPRIPYHSIIGFNGKGILETGGDGVVPYTSAHVDGALSELVVKSDHSAEEKEPTIAEIRRILVEHLRESSTDREDDREMIGPPPVRFSFEPPPRSSRDRGRVRR